MHQAYLLQVQAEKKEECQVIIGRSINMPVSAIHRTAISDILGTLQALSIFVTDAF
jgi:hypothetical protein